MGERDGLDIYPRHSGFRPAASIPASLVRWGGLLTNIAHGLSR